MHAMIVDGEGSKVYSLLRVHVVFRVNSAFGLGVGVIDPPS